MNNTHYVIVLPTYGAPYIHSSQRTLESLQAAVGGSIEPFDRKAFAIHPMFLDSEKNGKRWTMARQMLTSPLTKVYVNEEGRSTCDPNMATITASRVPLFGDVAVVVTKRVFDVICPNVLDMAHYGDDDEEDEDRPDVEEVC
jgi:hypothetical protein